ncbi:MAG: energy transducer TonB [Polyangiales bacterium]
MSTRTALDRVLAFDTRPPILGWAAVALSLHVGLGALLARRAMAAPIEPQITEVEFTPTEPPPEQPLPPDPSPSPSPSPSPISVTAAPKPQPALGKAAPILAAKTEAPAKNDDPTSFVTDPDGNEFGSGPVGAGGTAEKGEKDGKPEAPPHPPAPVSTAKPSAPAMTITPPANLSRAPKLDGADPCRGFFPADADEDKAVVSVAVVVRPDGSVASANIVKESVAGQGFGKAARSCLLSTKFSPALDSAGKTTAAAATVNVRFAR